MEKQKQKQAKPVLPNIVVQDRMFHTKPYTKCFECLAEQRMKCQKCMQKMINEMSDMKGERNMNRFHKKSTSFFSSNGEPSGMKKKQLRRFKSQIFPQNKQNETKIVITNQYNHWMNLRKNKRKHSKLESTLFSNWPRKTIKHDYNLQKYGAKQPKFEKWEKKLLDTLIAKTKC